MSTELEPELSLVQDAELAVDCLRKKVPTPVIVLKIRSLPWRRVRSVESTRSTAAFERALVDARRR